MYTTRYRSHHDASRALKKRFTSEMSSEEYLAQELRTAAKKPLVLYLHVPFCNKICSFCPFHRPDELKRREYHDYLIENIRAVSEYPLMQGAVGAVNFGGGTPTALTPAQMDTVLKELHERFNIQDDAEISVESSAMELTDEMLEVLVKNKVNRVSIGIQSFQDEARKLFGRRRSGELAAERILKAKEYGIINTNIDLIYNYPGQTQDLLKADLEMIRSLGIAGLSFYALMLHENTPLYDSITAEQKAQMQDIEREYYFYSMITEELAKSGFEALELTKLVRDKLDSYTYMELRHTGGNCIALGHGAGGNLGNYYYQNSHQRPVISNDIRVSSKGRVVTDEYRIIDEFIYELQKSTVDLDVYSKRLGISLDKCLAESMERLREEGLILQNENKITFTNKGRFWGNNVIDEFVRCILKEYEREAILHI